MNTESETEPAYAYAVIPTIGRYSSSDLVYPRYYPTREAARATARRQGADVLRVDEGDDRGPWRGHWLDHLRRQHPNNFVD